MSDTLIMALNRQYFIAADGKRSSPKAPISCAILVKLRKLFLLMELSCKCLLVADASRQGDELRLHR